MLGLLSTAYAMTSPPSALTRARAVAAAAPPQLANASRVGGEFESAEWWEAHTELFAAARAEWGRLHPELYNFDEYEDLFVDAGLRAAVEAAEAAAALGGPVDESALRAHLRPTGVVGTYRLRLFTAHFCELLRDELQHAERSGVPLRRPNG